MNKFRHQLGITLALLFVTPGCCHRVRSVATAEDLLHCQERLKNLWGVVMTVRADSGGSFPTNLSDSIRQLGGGSTAALAVLYCPARVGPRPAPDCSDFWYINWSRYFTNGFDVPASYPLFYERQMDNHGVIGVNVVTVNGYVFFDRGGFWMTRFIRENERYNLVPLRGESTR